MDTDHFILILSAEALIVCLVISGLVLLKNRKLRESVDQLQARLKELSARCKQFVAPPSAPPLLPQPQASYSDTLDEQLALTKEHHRNLGTHQDIALDLDPDAPQDRRIAALRHAFLIAEKEAVTTDQAVNWNLLTSRYLQLLSFHADYAEADPKAQEELKQAEESLQLARKRINNLERFKAMYFELEARWEHCKGRADERYNKLQALADGTEQAEDFRRLLDEYHTTYGDIGAIIEAGQREPANTATDIPADSQLHELQRLRSVAAEQHRIISELQSRLNSETDPAKQAVVMESLHSELQKQSRFLQESETCIKLMEDELANANRELEQLRHKASLAAELRSQVQDMQENADSSEQMIGALQQENRRLARKLKLAQEAPPEDNREARALRKQVTSLQAKYNDLEEKFLDLKLKE